MLAGGDAGFGSALVASQIGAKGAGPLASIVKSKVAASKRRGRQRVRRNRPVSELRFGYPVVSRVARQPGDGRGRSFATPEPDLQSEYEA